MMKSTVIAWRGESYQRYLRYVTISKNTDMLVMLNLVVR